MQENEIMNNPMIIKVLLTCFLSMLIWASLSTAQDKVVVVPFFTNKKIPNIVTVAKSGGDFTDPIAALESIQDAWADNPYLVLISPGKYTLNKTLLMKEYVSIIGADKSNTYLIGNIGSGSVEASAALVNGNDSATLSGLTISNFSDKDVTIGIYNESASGLFIQDVNVSVSGNNIYGIYNKLYGNTTERVNISANGNGVVTGIHNLSSNHVMKDIKVKIEWGTTAYGIYNDESSYIEMSNIEVEIVTTPTASYGIYNSNICKNSSMVCSLINNVNIGINGDGACYGVYNGSSKLEINHLNSKVVGKGTNYGIHNVGSSSLVLNYVMSETSNQYNNPTSTNYGVYNSNDSELKIYHSKIVGTTKGIFVGSSKTTHVVGSSIIGGIEGTGTITCLNSNNGIDKEFDSNCSSL